MRSQCHRLDLTQSFSVLSAITLHCIIPNKDNYHLLFAKVQLCVVHWQGLQCERGKREVVRMVPGGAHKVDAVAISYENVA